MECRPGEAWAGCRKPGAEAEAGATGVGDRVSRSGGESKGAVEWGIQDRVAGLMKCRTGDWDQSQSGQN